MELIRLRKVTMGVCMDLALASLSGCLTAAKSAEIDARYDAAIARCEAKFGERAYPCSGIEPNRQREKDDNNNPLTRMMRFFGLGRCGKGGNTTFVRVMS